MIGDGGATTLSGAGTQVWAAQYAGYMLGLFAVCLATPRPAAWRAAMGMVGVLWLWGALACWMPGGSRGDWLRPLVAALFLMQGVLLLIHAAGPSRPAAPLPRSRCWMGAGIMLYALAGYPLVALLTGHPVCEAPCAAGPAALVTFTMGFLLLSGVGAPPGLWIVPLLYSLTGAISLASGRYQGAQMLLSGLITGWACYRAFKRPDGASDTRSDPPSRGGWSLDITDRAPPGGM
ncbi:MAG: DUF6064 family protein [Anaerolineae bacterium]